MKKSFAVFVFLIIVTALYSNIFIDMYHKDYGIIDRSILVFSQKPQFKIIQNENDIQLNIVNCRKDINIQNTRFPNSAVIESFDYYSTEDKVMVIISINREHQLVVGEKYKLEVEEVSDDIFRLILDIYATKKPTTYQHYTSFAYFYEATGKSDLAKPYREMAEKLRSEMTPEELAELDQARTDNLQQGNLTPTRKAIGGMSGFLTPSRIILIIIGILLIVAIIYTVSLVLKPKEVAQDFSTSSLRLENGFGSENFKRELIYKLEKHFWGVEEIAKELEMHPSLVYRASAPDFADELEKV